MVVWAYFARVCKLGAALCNLSLLLDLHRFTKMFFFVCGGVALFAFVFVFLVVLGVCLIFVGLFAFFISHGFNLFLSLVPHVADER